MTWMHTTAGCSFERLLCLGVAVLALSALPVQAAKPSRDDADATPNAVSQASKPQDLAATIDRRIEQGFESYGVEPAALASDGEFLRRVWLDFAGRVPSVATTRAFLADEDPNKRHRVIDELLGRPEFDRQFAKALDVWLMERRRDQHVKQPEWYAYLVESVASDKPLDQLCRELITADGSELDPLERAPAKFLLDREAEKDTLVRDIGRLFLGTNLQCAQCHDHPLVGDYLQKHYYGLAAFFDGSAVVTDPVTKLAMLQDAATTQVTYVDVFSSDKDKYTTGPQLPEGEPLEFASFGKGEEYFVPPAKNVRAIPKVERRAMLAERLAAAENRAFARNWANRLWAYLMGRGIVDPVEMHHSANPPSHPKLLEELTDGLIDVRFDAREFLRRVAKSDTYQRSSELPASWPADSEPYPPESFGVFAITPLSPEALAWSMMQATGYLENQEKAIVAARLKADPKFGPLVVDDPEWRLEELEKKVAGYEKQFVSTFGATPGTPEVGFEASLSQALYVANANTVIAWAKASGDNLSARLRKLSEPQQVADELYLATLTRKPTADETKAVADYLATREADRNAAIEEMIWALVASSEFRFDH